MIAQSLACSVPVFRYALERWPPDAYQATIFTAGDLNDEAMGTLSYLNAAKANLHVTVVDLQQASEGQRALWEEQDSPTLPWIYVAYPEAHPVAIELISGVFNDSFAREVIESPFRRDLAEQLVTSETAVWIMIECGDSSKDEAVWTLLNAQIDLLESTLELPTIEEEDIEAGLISVDENSLKIAFSSRRLSRKTPADEVLARMLLDTEDDLIDRDEPMVFPIFGRGRVLYGLVGDGITEETIALAAQYLTGACSCQVKSENPGIDLLMAMDWDARVESSLETDRDLPELAGIVAQPPTSGAVPTTEVMAPETSPLPSPPAGGGHVTTDQRLLWITLAAMVLMLVIVGAGSAFFSTKKT